MADLQSLNGKLLSLYSTSSQEGINKAVESGKGALVIYTDPDHNTYHSAYILDKFIASGYGVNSEIDKENLTYVANTYTGFALKSETDKDVWLTVEEFAALENIDEDTTYNIYEEV